MHPISAIHPGFRRPRRWQAVLLILVLWSLPFLTLAAHGGTATAISHAGMPCHDGDPSPAHDGKGGCCQGACWQCQFCAPAAALQRSDPVRPAAPVAQVHVPPVTPPLARGWPEVPFRPPAVASA